MATHVKHVTPAVPPGAETAADGDTLAALRRDCAGMLPHWRVPAPDDVPGEAPAARPPHGVSVPERTVRLLRGMSEYGD
ncbi:hypothetical protein J7W19_08565 [Streptomyces mobaraensis NBRC 13819 = DSM 40847]|uniref:Uncharacterized protein n=1 Tax=Streptomyces mobaraensis TaxID=35621 RepID=A0A5N5W597_STRMB|nr:hypothetical protein [Streptomyces mobaraensis]KAB7842592.1 hypothetical protein FRZ00_19525 [Streptomyces mobaraensis]QTT73467.1 hypothetical protein J7W19_08565 [Streptomyces mobaraensis NBRC 13819 = DSM 40847]